MASFNISSNTNTGTFYAVLYVYIIASKNELFSGNIDLGAHITILQNKREILIGSSLMIVKAASLCK